MSSASYDIFFILGAKQQLTKSVVVLPYDWASFCYMLDDQLCLQPHIIIFSLFLEQNNS